MEETKFGCREQEAYRAIRNFLFERKLSPGQKIIYRDLEQWLGMSKTPIINALFRLENEGLLVSQPNRGFYVKSFSKDDIIQIFDLKTRLMYIALEYAIDRHDNSDLVGLKAALDEYLNYPLQVYDSKRFLLDVNFHIYIAKMGKNSYLTSMVKQFYENVFIAIDVAFLSPLIPQFMIDHELIYRAITVRDLQEAIKLTQNHIRAAQVVAASQK